MSSNSGMTQLPLDTECANRAKLTAPGHRLSGELNSDFQNITFYYCDIKEPHASAA